MELTCDPGFRIQPSFYLFQISTSIGRPSNWRVTMGFPKQLGGSLILETGDSIGLRSPG